MASKLLFNEMLASKEIGAYISELTFDMFEIAQRVRDYLKSAPREIYLPGSLAVGS